MGRSRRPWSIIDGRWPSDPTSPRPASIWRSCWRPRAEGRSDRGVRKDAGPRTAARRHRHCRERLFHARQFLGPLGQTRGGPCSFPRSGEAQARARDRQRPGYPVAPPGTAPRGHRRTERRGLVASHRSVGLAPKGPRGRRTGPAGRAAFRRARPGRVGHPGSRLCRGGPNSSEAQETAQKALDLATQQNKAKLRNRSGPKIPSTGPTLPSAARRRPNNSLR